MQKRRTLSIRFTVLCLAASLGFSLPCARPILAQNSGLNGGLDDSFDTLAASTPVYEPSVLEPLNEKMFSFNIWMDEHILRPAARVYIGTVPEKGRLGVQRVFTNLGVVPRFANSLFQLKLRGAAREAGRFVIISTIGGLGFFDIAKAKFGL